MSKMSTCTLFKPLVMTQQGSRNRWVIGATLAEICFAYSMASVLFSSKSDENPEFTKTSKSPNY